MRPIVIAVANRKGGVGKTTVTIALAHTFQAQFGLPTVVIDTDPQGSASLALVGEDAMSDAIRQIALDHTLFSGILDSPVRDIGKIHREQVSRLSDRPGVPLGLVPITPAFWEQEAAARRKPTLWNPIDGRIAMRFDRMVKTLSGQYQVILIDTPPGQSLLYDKSVRLADRILVPCVPDKMSIWGMDVLHREFLASTRPTASKHILWTQFANNSSWENDAWSEISARGDYFRHFFQLPSQTPSREHDQLLGLPSLVNVPRAVTSVEFASWAHTYPGSVQPTLVRICEDLLREHEDDS